MACSIVVTPSAARELGKLPHEIQKRIVKTIDDLAENPRPSGTKALSGEDGILRIRVGDYRVLYTVQDGALIVLVVKIGNRRDVYRK